jgi:DNA-binding HxlR family transcriptional regulator
VNHDLWSEHLAARVAELEDELRRTRQKYRSQRQRAEYWCSRALREAAARSGSLGAVSASTAQSRMPGTRVTWASRESA